jgi:Xaa-Pro aminopeptidase
LLSAVRLIVINADFFPDRYKSYTTFCASYGIVIADDNDQYPKSTLFLDDRYLSAAKTAGYHAFPLKECPRENVIINGWEWTIHEHKFFKSYQSQSSDELRDDNFNQTKVVSKINCYLTPEFKFPYLISNTLFSIGPTAPRVITSDGSIKKVSLNDLKNVYFDPEITPLFFLEYLDSCNTVTDEYKIRRAIVQNVDEYRVFQQREARSWMKFWQELESNFMNYTEQSCAVMFLKIRQKECDDENLKNAYDPIVASGPSSAFIHYSSSNALLKSGLLLVDIGSKIIINGEIFISDITRTFWLGNDEPDLKIKEAYTKVLKAHIAVATAILQPNDPIECLDKIAHEIVEFSHALGHGVGDEVHVHPVISQNNSACFLDGMIITNEPGYYIIDSESGFGIRLESELRVELSKDVRFEYLTFVPFDRKLILFDNLTKNEKEWLSVFHEICYNKLNGSVDQSFLRAKCNLGRIV